MARTRKQRSDAAKRGWATRREFARRAAAEFARRSAASRKGWATRRAAVTTAREALPPYEPPSIEELEDFSDEWEIGFEYRGADKGSHVDVNIRIAREDGEQFGAGEAARVLTAFRQSLEYTGAPEIPAGYLMAFIDWHRPRWGTSWQSGDDMDLVSFRNPMYTEVGDTSAWSILPAGDLRLGSVKK